MLGRRNEIHSDKGSQRDRHLAVAATTGVLTKPITVVSSLLALGACARGLPGVEFGVLATITTISGLFAFADFGFGNSLMTRLAGALGADDLPQSRALVSSTFCALSAIAAALLVAGVALVPWIHWARILGASESLSSAVALSMTVFVIFRSIAIPGCIGQRIHCAAQQGGRANLWNLAGALPSAIGCLVASELNSPLWVYVFALTGIPVIFSLLETGSVFAFEHTRLTPRPVFMDRSTVVALARLGGLFFVLSAASAIAYQTDTLVTASILGAAAAGTFTIAARMFSAVSTLLVGMSAQLWTATVGAIAIGDIAWVRSRFRLMIMITLVVAIPSNTGLVIFGQRIAKLWVGEQNVPPISLLIVTAVWGVYSSVMGQVALIMNAFEVIKAQIVMASAMAVSNILLSIALTRYLGISGPVLGSLVSHILFNGLPAIYIVRRLLRDMDAVHVPGPEGSATDFAHCDPIVLVEPARVDRTPVD
jgi:O-antigen/teichoic acid export membrane protein